MTLRMSTVGVLATCAALLLATVADAKVFGRCALAHALKNKGIPAKDIATWVCLGERLSSIDTAATTDPNNDPDGTVYHGVFLINSNWWCDQGKRGCGVTCEHMKRTLDSNIDCAIKVFRETRLAKRDGFKAWQKTYTTQCQHPENYIRGCRGLGLDGDAQRGNGPVAKPYRRPPRHSSSPARNSTTVD